MNGATTSVSKKPSTEQAFAFFAKYRKDVEAKRNNEGEARQLAGSEANMITQAHESGSNNDRVINEVPSDIFIPVDQSKGTPSFRLRNVKRSPINRSPDLLSAPKSLLPPPMPKARQRITLVLDVDETLVHSSFDRKPGFDYDKELLVRNNQQLFTVLVKFRPYLHDFLNFVSERFEVVIFTASLSIYCNPLMDCLDPEGKLGNLRLFREHCTPRSNSYIKDLFLLGRELGRIAIIDNSPTAYLFQQRNAIPIKSWFGDPDDQELLKLYPLLAKLASCKFVYDVLDAYNANGVV